MRCRSDESNFLSAVYLHTKPLRSPRLVSLNSLNFDQKRCNTSKGFRALFVYCVWSTNDSFFSVFSIAAFLSFTSFCSDSQLCVVRVFNKTIILLGLAGLWNDHDQPAALHASLVIYHFGPARPRRIIREFKVYDATVAKTSLKIASSSLSIIFIIREFKIYDETAATTPQILHI